MSQDFNAWVFSCIKVVWAPNEHARTVLLLNSYLPKYLTTKLKKSALAVLWTMLGPNIFFLQILKNFKSFPMEY